MKSEWEEIKRRQHKAIVVLISTVVKGRGKRMSAYKWKVGFRGGNDEYF